MKKLGIFSIMLLFLTSILGLFPAGATALAQENYSEYIQVDVNVFLQMNGAGPAPQSQISYDIIQPNPAGGDGTVIWSYRSDNPPAEPLFLTPGDYRFRLFDGGNFFRDGKDIVPLSFEQTIATLTDEDMVANRNKRSLNAGQINEWSDGQRVYDVPFSLGIGDNIYNPNTGLYEVDLEFILGDNMTASSNEETGLLDQANAQTHTSTSAEEGYSPDQAVLKMLVIDDMGSPMSGVSIFVNGNLYPTDEYGQMEITNLVPGQEISLEVEAPEGYTGSGSRDPFIIEAGKIYEAEIQMTQTEETPAEAGQLTITVHGPSQEPVANVLIEANGQQVWTNELGQAVFENIAAGEVNYWLVEVPEGYTPEETSGFVKVDGFNGAQAEINLSKEAVNGSIQFVVHDSNGLAMPNVEILINNQVVTTDSTGTATVEGLEAGGYSYTVISGPEGYQYPLEGTVNIDAGEVLTEETDLEETVEFGWVNISVIDEEGLPIPGAQITFDGQPYQTNGEGAAIIEGIRAGETYAYGLASLPADYEMEDEPASQTIEIKANEEAQGQIVVKQPSTEGTVEISIVDSQGVGVSDVTIAIHDQSAVTDPQGKVVFEGLEAGIYTYYITDVPEGFTGALQGEITVNADQISEGNETLNEIPTTGDVTFVVTDQEGQTVTGTSITLRGNEYHANENGEIIIQYLPSGDSLNYTLGALPEGYKGQASGTVTVPLENTETVMIEVERDITPARLTISLVDQTNQAVRGAEISLNTGDKLLTDESGQAVFTNLAPETYEYQVTNLPEDYTADVGPQSINLTEGADEERQIILERRIQAGSAILTVIDQDEELIEGAVLSLNNQTYTTNSQGQVKVADLQPGTYTYTITHLPEGYTGLESGEITISEDEEASSRIPVQRIVELATASLTVQDQNGQAVEGAEIAFGGLTGSTNSSGVVNFIELEPGNYNLSITNVPQAFNNTYDERLIEIEEGAAFEEIMTVERRSEVGTVRILIKDKNNQAIPDARVELNDQRVRTDRDGYATFGELEEGVSYTYRVVSLPAGYDIDAENGQVTAIANETATIALVANSGNDSTESEAVQSSSSSSSNSSSSETELENAEESTVGNVEESSTITSEQQALIDAEADEATKQFLHADSGVEVWINPVDAADVVRVDVKEIKEVGSLENADAEAYQIRLLNKDNQTVNLTRLAEVKVPTRPVNTQLQVVRVNESDLSNLTFSLHNQRVTFRTQELGDFAVVYRAGGPGNTTETAEAVNVSMESSVKKQDNLPGTGEQSMYIILILAVGLVAAGLFIIFHRRKDSGNKH